MASRRDRQRKLERARTERRIARQAASQRRRRQIQAAIGAGLALILIAFGTIWLLGGFESKPAPTENVAAGTCTWNLLDPDPAKNVFDTGHPPITGERRTGTEKMSIKTNLGDIEAELDLAKAPCTAASFGFLAEKKYFDGGKCHRVNTDTLFVVQCGDPSGTGQGRPSYRFANENVPVEPTPTATATATPAPTPTPSVSPGTSPTHTNLYPKGTIAMANSGSDTNGSQFFIVYADGAQLGPEYTIAGKVTKGLDVLQKVATGGAVNSEGKDVKDGTPKTELIIQTLTVGDAPPTPTPTPTG